MSGAQVRGRPERIPPRNGSSSIGSIPVGNLSALPNMGQEISPGAKSFSGGKSGNCSGGPGCAGGESLRPTKHMGGNLSGMPKFISPDVRGNGTVEDDDDDDELPLAP